MSARLSPVKMLCSCLALHPQLIPREEENTRLQEKTLRFLLNKSRFTAFGQYYGFEDLLRSASLADTFRQRIPLHTFENISKQWWHRSLSGEDNVCWPGKTRYFALSSGTAGAASKRIPVSDMMIRQVKKMGLRQMAGLRNFGVPAATYSKQVLMIGGSTSLDRKTGYFEGDMSGICARNMPYWLSEFYYKPGRRIAALPQWSDRIQAIADQAPQWDIGTICGIPAWVQMVLEKIIAQHGLGNIHQLWPNLKVYIHGGVAFEPYRDSFLKLLGTPLSFIETYMASEGSFGFKVGPGAGGIRLFPNAGIFYEFIPFKGRNFDSDGNLTGDAETHTLHEVREGIPYAVVISTCSGAWRYLIGDVVEFVNARRSEIRILGRTRQFINLCGEHVSIDNLNASIQATAKEYKLGIGEFTVYPCKTEQHFTYKWFIGLKEGWGTDDTLLGQSLDNSLCALNDDYRIARKAGIIKGVTALSLPDSIFNNYLKKLNREGGMNKFPRVLSQQTMTGWESYLQETRLLTQV